MVGCHCSNLAAQATTETIQLLLYFCPYLSGRLSHLVIYGKFMPVVWSTSQHIRQHARCKSRNRIEWLLEQLLVVFLAF